MSGATTNYGLVKPLPEEFYDVAVQNGNMDIIDAVLKSLADDLGAVPSDTAKILHGWKSGLTIEFVDSVNIKITPGTIHIKNGNSETIVAKSTETILPVESGLDWTIFTIDSAGVIHSYMDVPGLRPAAACLNSGDKLLGYYYADGERVVGAATPLHGKYAVINLGCYLEEVGCNQYGHWERHTDGRLVTYGRVVAPELSWTTLDSLYYSQKISLPLIQSFADSILNLMQTITCWALSGSHAWASNATNFPEYTAGDPLNVRIIATNEFTGSAYIDYIIRGHWA